MMNKRSKKQLLTGTLLMIWLLSGCSQAKKEETKESEPEEKTEQTQNLKDQAEEEKPEETESRKEPAEVSTENSEILSDEDFAQPDPQQSEPVAGTEQSSPAPLEEPSADGSAVTIVEGIAVVNKKHPVRADYTPGEDPVALSHLMELISDMQKLGYNVGNTFSGFRSYDYQNTVYTSYVAANGQALADTFSARPGYSEHQTGLAFDLKHQDGQLLTGAAETDWVAAHAHEYGFIVRYQEGKEDITGYMPEPWHLRYIGDRAKEICASGLTLEEYLGVEGGDYN